MNGLLATVDVNVPLVAGVLGGIVVGTVAAYRFALPVLRHSVESSEAVARAVFHHLRLPLMLVVLLSALEVSSVGLPLPRLAGAVAVHVIGTVLVGAVAWAIVRVTYVLRDVALARHPLDAPDNLRARQLQTQIELLRRVVVVLVSVVGLAVVLLSFPSVRAIGAGLLASAGLIGVIAGIAAQPLASNLVAGIQIALTEPIRTDDVVVVNGEWGRIEEIHLTFVVVRIWDLRRLIVPISYFTSQPFENWTRSTADILGWTLMEVDYSAPVEKIRSRFKEVVAASANWDGKVAVLQVTNLGLTMQLRALTSSADSSRSWDLQCEVREKLIAFLQENYPWALPRLRTQLAAPVEGGDGEEPPAARRPRRASANRT